MYVLFNLKFLSFTTILFTIYSQETQGDKKGPGESSCNIISLYYCNDELISSDKFPSCTSFIFTSLCIDESYTISFCFNGSNNVYLDTLGTSGKKLYVNFGRDNYTAWSEMLDCDGKNAETEGDAISAVTSGKGTIKGLIIRNIGPPLNDSVEYVGYTESVLKYIETVKRKTGLEIGLTFRADEFLPYYDKPKFSWLNFTVLDPCVDFYVLSLLNFANECSGKSAGRRDGALSINGDYKYTLEKLKDAITKSLIPTKKLYFNIVLGPQAMDDNICEQSYQTLCECPEKGKYWCTDTQETFFKQGQWFRQNGAGFIGSFIDTDDPQNVCKCGKFPTFNAILAGFNGAASVPPCALYDRPV